MTEIFSSPVPFIIRRQREWTELRRVLADEPDAALPIIKTLLEECGALIEEADDGRSIIARLSGARPGHNTCFAAQLPASCVEEAADWALQTTVALGTAQILAARRRDWQGTVRFLFYPAGRAHQLPQKILTDSAYVHALRSHAGPAGEVMIGHGTVASGLTRFVLRLSYREGLTKSQWEEIMCDAVRQVAALSTHPHLTAENISRLLRNTAVRERCIRAGILRTDIDRRDIRFYGYTGVYSRTLHRLTAERLQLLAAKLEAHWNVSFSAGIFSSLPPVVNAPSLCTNACEILRGMEGVVCRGSRRLLFPFKADDYAHLQQTAGGLLFLLGTGGKPLSGGAAEGRILETGVCVTARLLTEPLKESAG